MRPSIIADSSGLVSLISNTDQNHKIALNVARELQKTQGSIIVPGDVFSETINVIGKKISHDSAVTAGKEILNSQVFLIVEGNDEIRKKSFELFIVQAQSVSFIDCVVIAFADQFKTKSIFGFDQIFHKSKYMRLALD